MENLDKAAPGIFITLGGVQRSLIYTFDAVKKLKRITGKNLLKGEVDWQDPDEFVYLLWAGLIANDPSLDGGVDATGTLSDAAQAGVDAIGKLITLGDLGTISNALMETFKQATPDSGEDKKGKKA